MSASLVIPKILLCGDSLTQLSFEGWGAQLANVYQRRADVVNRGLSGYNTRYYLHALPDILQELVSTSQTVCLVVLFFGANDAALAEVDVHHHVPLDEYESNLTIMVKLISEALGGASSSSSSSSSSQLQPHFLLVTPPPVHHGQRLQYQKERYGMNATGVLERTNETTGLYAAACQRVATQLHLPCLNLYENMMKVETKTNNDDDDSNDDVVDWDRFLSDGLHLSPAGHDFVAHQLLEAISIHFAQDLAVVADPVTGQFCNSSSHCGNRLTTPFPYHDEISNQNPKEAFKKKTGS